MGWLLYGPCQVQLVRPTYDIGAAAVVPLVAEFQRKPVRHISGERICPLVVDALLEP